MDQPTVTRVPSEAGQATVLRAKGLCKSYWRGPEEVRALQDADIELREGEVVALVGPSGSGKTTLLNVICGWEQPDTGSLTWPSADDAGEGMARPWGEVAIVPQDLGLIEELSVAGNVELPLWLAGRLDQAGHAATRELLERFGLEGYAGRAPGELSLGEQQRVALARAMVLAPRLLVADEPTGHQDAGWAAVVLKALRWIASKGTCCLVATHSQELLEYADRVLPIRDGRLAGSAAAIERPGR